jgi:hypothetical protein
LFAAVGLNVAEIVQLPAAARVAPQVVVSAKLETFVPPSEIVTPVSIAVPVFVSVTVWAALVVAICVVGNEIAVLDRDAWGATAEPLRMTLCGEPVALSATLSIPLAVPAAVGRKPTEIVQLAAGASVAEQADISLNPTPLTATAIPVKVAVPGLESVTVCGAAELATVVAANVNDAGVNTASATGAAALPAPVRLTLCVEPETLPLLSVTVSTAPYVTPAAAGVKVRAKVQELPAAKVAVQLVPKTEKFDGFAPLNAAGSVRLSGPVPELVSVTFCAVAVLPAAVLGKVKDEGDSAAVPTVDDVPVPARVSMTAGLEVLSAAEIVSVSDPADCGEKLNTRMQLAFGARVEVEVLHVLAEVSVNELVAPVIE